MIAVVLGSVTFIFFKNSTKGFGTPDCGLMSIGMCLVSEKDAENSLDRLENTHLNPLGLCEHTIHGLE